MVVQLGVTGVGVQGYGSHSCRLHPTLVLWRTCVGVDTTNAETPVTLEGAGVPLIAIVHVVVTGIYFSPVSRRMMSPSRYARFPSRLVLVAT